MAEEKKAFVLYADLHAIFKKLSDIEAGTLFKHILEYVNGNTAPSPERWINIVFISIKKDIDEYERKKHKGPDHWNWKEGVTSENKSIRNGKEIKQWRRLVFERDNYTCQNCSQKGGTLHAHHILYFSKYPDKRFCLDNGLTLCKSCHLKIHSRNG